RCRHLGATRGDEAEGDADGGETQHAHWNLWRTVTSSRALRSRLSLYTGNVVFLISILYLPGSSLSVFIGGTTPRDLPFTKISPQGVTAKTSVAGGTVDATFVGSVFEGSAFASPFAASGFVASPTFVGAEATFDASVFVASGAGAGI